MPRKRVNNWCPFKIICNILDKCRNISIINCANVNFKYTALYTFIKTINKHTSIDGTVLKSTFAFRVQGYKGNVEVFNNVIGIDFEPNSALSDQVTLASVRGDIDKVVVTEINSGNYTPDPVTQEVTSSSATGYSVVNNRQVFTFSFDNTQSGKEYNTGVINRYEKNDSGYGPPSSGGSQP